MPTSLTIAKAVTTSMPSISVRSTPVTSYSAKRTSKRGSFSLRFRRRGLGDSRGAVLAAAVAVPRQRHRVTLAAQDVLDDGQARHPRDVGDHLRQLQVHLLQRLQHVLDVLAGVADVVGTQPQQAPQHAGVLVGPKCRRQQAVGVQPLDPLAVEPITLGAALDLPGVAGVGQQHLKAAMPPCYPTSARRSQVEGLR
jgi:hypothetical protein